MCQYARSLFVCLLLPRYENATGNYMKLTTLLVLTWERASPVPPPLRLLSLPYYAWLCTHRLCAFPCQRKQHDGRSYEQISDQQIKHVQANAPHHHCDSEVLKTAVTLPPSTALRGVMEVYVEAHATEANAEDDRWRARLARDIKDVKYAMKKELTQVTQEVNKVEVQVQESKLKMDELNNKLDEEVGEVNLKLERILKLLAEAQIPSQYHAPTSTSLEPVQEKERTPRSRAEPSGISAAPISPLIRLGL